MRMRSLCCFVCPSRLEFREVGGRLAFGLLEDMDNGNSKRDALERLDNPLHGPFIINGLRR